MPLTEIYDLVWIIEKSEEYWEDSSENGMAQVILVAVYMMFVFKIILFFVLWKASINFEKFVK